MCEKEARLKQMGDDAASQFDSSLVQDRVYESVAFPGAYPKDSDLANLLELIEGALDLAQDRDDAGDYHGLQSDAYAAAEILEQNVEDTRDETVATALVGLLSRLEDDRDLEPDERDRAKHEAREWLQEHHEAAQRAGVWSEVTA